MADTQDLIVRLTMENGQFNSAVVKSDNVLKKSAKTTKGLTATVKKLRLAYVAVAAVVAGSIVKGFTSLIKRASDAQETLQKFGVVFKSNIGDANKAVKELNASFGLSRQEARRLLSDTGDLLSGFGFTGESALALSEDVQKLAVDLASFTNIEGGAERASKALTAALLGEREQVKALGIAILEEDVKAKVKALEATGRFTNETERQRKAIATYEIAVSQSKNALGDFERSQGSLANQFRVLQGALSDIAIAIGKRLLPIITPIVSALADFAKTDESLDAVADATFRVVNAFIAWWAIIRTIGGAVKEVLIDPLITSIKALLVIAKILNPFTTSTKTVKKEMENLGKAFNDTFDISGVIDGAKDAVDAFKNVIGGLKDTTDEAAESSDKMTKKSADNIAKLTDAQSLQLQAYIEGEKTKTQTAIEEGEKLLKIEALTAKQIQAVENKLQDLRTQKVLAESQKRLGYLSNFASQSQALSQGTSDLANNLIDQTTKNEEEAEKKKRDAKRVTATIEKITALFSIGVNTARAIVGFLADPGGAVGTGLSIAAGVTGGIQAAAVAAKPIPTFENGGLISGLNTPIGNEDGLIAAQNGESVLTREATAILGEDAINALNSGRSIAPNVNITVNSNDGSEVVSTLNRYFKSFGGSRELGIG